jgi:hypothetical protein
MKLRIKGNTLRLRLTQTEVARLGAEEGGRVEDEVLFAPGVSLRYAIEARDGADAADAPRADYADGAVRVVVSASVARRWIASDDPGIAGEQPNGSADPLRILIEKDFACLHRESEDADAFPNPAHA